MQKTGLKGSREGEEKRRRKREDDGSVKTRRRRREKGEREDEDLNYPKHHDYISQKVKLLANEKWTLGKLSGENS